MTNKLWIVKRRIEGEEAGLRHSFTCIVCAPSKQRAKEMTLHQAELASEFYGAPDLELEFPITCKELVPLVGSKVVITESIFF